MPKVSVIIPNYNHAQYLHQRIDSVLSQTFQDFEVILLDDYSSDGSRDIINDYVEKDSRICSVFNKQNSGNTFKQWNKGISLAKGEYIWIAESDDYAEDTFLENLVTILDVNRVVGLAYCDSWIANEDGQILSEMKQAVNKYLETDIWNNNFLFTGKEYLRKYMSFTNVIPNASAVLLRKSVLDKIGPARESMRLAGDWLYWNTVLQISDVFYNKDTLNYFRTHTNNVRSKTLKNGILLEETSAVMAFTKLALPHEVYNQAAIKMFLDKWVQTYRAGSIPFFKNFLIAKNISIVLGSEFILLKKLINFLIKY